MLKLPFIKYFCFIAKGELKEITIYYLTIKV